MNHTIKQIERAIHDNDFNTADGLLKSYKGSIDSLSIKSKAAANYISDYIKTFLPDFSITKSTLIKTLSNFLDKSQIHKVIIFSNDVNSLSSEKKIKALDCYLDNKQQASFDNDHKCLKKLLGDADNIPKHSSSVDILLAHTKCEPGINSVELKESFTMLYNMNPVIAKIMDVSAKACDRDKCHIIFTNDKNYSTKNDTSPSVVTTGYYNGVSDIFISSNREKPDYYGTFIHELTHYSMNSIYKHNSNPYPKIANQSKYVSTEKEYHRIADAVDYLIHHKDPKNYEQTHVHDTIKGLKQWYDSRDYDCELVVRYPHMIAANTPEKDVNYYLKALEMYYHSHLMPDMDNYLVA
jgi:hypothetical protein